LDQARFAIIPFFTRIYSKPLVTLGIEENSRISPYKEYAKLYTIGEVVGRKAYSHTHLQSKNTEATFLNNIINNAYRSIPNAKALKLIFSNRRSKFTKYLLETQILL
jgi:hypothetical protein